MRYTFASNRDHMNIQLVVFDLAGTTIKDDNNVHQVLQSALAKSGVHVSLAEANEVMGIPKPVAITKLLALKGVEISDKLIERIHHDFEEEMVSFYKHDPGMAEKEGASELFGRLKNSNIHVVVDTGFSRVITDAILQRTGWIQNNLIDGSVCSDEVDNGRPYPDMIFRAMNIVRVPEAVNVAKVGDTTFDLQEGRQAGCGVVIGLTDGAHAEETLAREYHTHLAENLEHVGRILLGDSFIGKRRSEQRL